eukprot:TRINITY_DN32283_c0_g1_i1.p1 TRINITY_DN32283_c0_g1~~TRINITY_DN32283_c0_g1_i1.p1  ORF type:complete len:742 (-),score=138.78 TRINITY_DN32283_c0_g1_i1:31-2256(-)
MTVGIEGVGDVVGADGTEVGTAAAVVLEAALEPGSAGQDGPDAQQHVHVKHKSLQRKSMKGDLPRPSGHARSSAHTKRIRTALRKAVYMTMATSRVPTAEALEIKAAVGSLLQFLDRKGLAATDVFETIPGPNDGGAKDDIPEEKEEVHDEYDAFGEESDYELFTPEDGGAPPKSVIEGEGDVLTPVKPSAPFPTVFPPPRRRIEKIGEQMSRQRAACARNQQLRTRLQDSLDFHASVYEDGDYMSKVTPRRCTPTEPATTGRPAPAAHTPRPDAGVSSNLPSEGFSKPPANWPRRPSSPQKAFGTAIQERHPSWRQRKFPETNFTAAVVADNSMAKPVASRHPLLFTIEQMQDREYSHGSKQTGQSTLTQRLEHLRNHGAGAGAAVSPSRRLAGDDARRAEAKALSALGTSSASGAGETGGGLKKRWKVDQEFEELFSCLDPKRTGKVSPQTFVPLFVWLGLTRRARSAEHTLTHAFGTGPISMTAIRGLYRYLDVQVNLIDGLREIGRKESLELFCDYINDKTRLQEWFGSMHRDQANRADIIEVQNLFARMEATKNSLTLFRFFRMELGNGSFDGGRSEKPQASAATSSAAATSAGTSADATKCTFGIREFFTMICRCTVAWCLHRTLIAMREIAEEPDADGGSKSLQGHTAMRWAQLRRKITVSIMINKNFWGREAKAVMDALSETGEMDNDDLTNEEWLSLFNRVKAQGFKSTLPSLDEVEDPNFLRNKTKHNEIY